METTFLELYDALKQQGLKWETVLGVGVRLYLEQNQGNDPLDETHTGDTPRRVVDAFADYIQGVSQDPAVFLERQFATGSYDQMVHVRSVKLRTMCAHHLCPIVGKVHFAYIPGRYVVGLSKIPRMVDALAHRPQVQEVLTQQLVDTFQDKVQPLGCGVHVRAYHFCMMHRGVEEHSTFTETTAFRGNFKDNALTRQEFLASLDHTEVIFP
jgi:GTP cyclohydrolase I